MSRLPDEHDLNEAHTKRCGLACGLPNLRQDQVDAATGAHVLVVTAGVRSVTSI